MAHIGVFGPVVFRRDFNLNVFSNAYGWFRRNLLLFHFLPPGSANVVNNFIFDCGPETYPDLHTIRWESPFYLIPVFQFKVQIQIQINDGARYVRTGQLIQKGAGLIFAWHWPYLDIGVPPGWSYGSTIFVDYWNPDWFDEEPIGTLPYVIPKQWTDGPPH